VKFLYVLARLRLHFSLVVSRQRRNDEARTDPVGAERAYRIRPIQGMIGKSKNAAVGMSRPDKTRRNIGKELVRTKELDGGRG
jgi:hypothetical protein